MKKIIYTAIIAIAITSPAVAQQQDAAFLTRAIGALSAQRNQALDSAAAQQARADGLQEELFKAQERIKELEKKPAEEKK